MAIHIRWEPYRTLAVVTHPAAAQIVVVFPVQLSATAPCHSALFFFEPTTYSLIAVKSVLIVPRIPVFAGTIASILQWPQRHLFRAGEMST